MERLFRLAEPLVLLVLPEAFSKTGFNINFDVPAAGVTPRDMLGRVIHFIVSFP
jgi:hypothetical protein